MVVELNIQHQYLSVRCSSEIILICGYAAKCTFLIIISIENICSAYNCVCSLVRNGMKVSNQWFCFWVNYSFNVYFKKILRIANFFNCFQCRNINRRSNCQYWIWNVSYDFKIKYQSEWHIPCCRKSRPLHSVALCNEYNSFVLKYHSCNHGFDSCTWALIKLKAVWPIVLYKFGPWLWPVAAEC